MNDDRGGATILIVIIVLTFLLIPALGFATDLGRIYLEQNRLQNAADIAAVSAVKELQVQHNDDLEWHWPFRSDTAPAVTDAVWWVQQNVPEVQAPHGRVTVKVTQGSVDVLIENDIDLGPAKLFKVQSPVTVRGHATAVLTWNPATFDHDHDGSPDKHDYNDYYGSNNVTPPPDAGSSATYPATIWVPKADGFRLYH